MCLCHAAGDRRGGGPAPPRALITDAAAHEPLSTQPCSVWPHLPLPLTQAPATSLDGNCSDVPRSRSEGVDRPGHCLIDVVRSCVKGSGTLRRMGCQGNREILQRDCETAATGLHVRLLLRPTTDEGLGVKVVGKSAQLVDFSCREEVPREFRVILLRPDVFDIDADVGLSGDGNEGKTGRVREVEVEPAAEPGAELGLAECLVLIADSARFGLEILPQELAQHSVRDDEVLTVALESKTRAPVPFGN